jgi:hypothetical protein
VADESSEFVFLRVRDAELVGDRSWVYCWIDENERVVYVGSTTLDPRTRAWLHLHDPDPELGRVAARFERLASAPLEILAMRVPDEVSRSDVRDVLGARLAEDGMLADDAITDHLQLVLEPGPEAVELADRYVTRLRAHLAPTDANRP